MNRPKPSQKPRLRLRVTAAAESRLRAGHPWLFSDSVREQNRPGETGELGVVYDRKDRFLAVGLFDPDSPIRLRVLHCGNPQELDAAWWQARLERALAARAALFDARTTGYRCLNGESDGWPGLVLDRYGEVMVLKVYTAAWLPRLGSVSELFANKLQPKSLVLRLSRNIMDKAREQFSLKDGAVLRGEANFANPVVFEESGLRFEADVVLGQKTGFFLDQRENRRNVELLASGKRVLNAFSFSGGFSLYSARGGARSVTDIDISAHALESARRNFALNAHLESVKQCQHESVQADAFDWFARSGGAPADVIVLDPPSLARREQERAGALSAYQRLASLAMGRLARAGALVACSCSAHVSAEEFFGAMRSCAAASGRSWKEIQTARHAPDHPATFKEAEYLKAIYLEFS